MSGQSPSEEEARLAAILAVLALVHGDAEGAAAVRDGAGRTGGEALARWRTDRLAALRHPRRRD